MARDPDFELNFCLVPYDKILNPFNPSTAQVYRMDYTDYNTLCGKMLLSGKIPTVYQSMVHEQILCEKL